MELNREQIVKALECFRQRILDTNLAKNIYEAEIMAIVDAIALIRELTEEKEKIAHESECHRQTVIDNLQRSLEYLNEETQRVKADTIRKMQERLKATPMWFVDKDTIDQIAQEMLVDPEN